MTTITARAKRRILTALAALSATAGLGLTATPAQAWPDQPITIIVPWPAGGPSDIAARPLSKGLSDALGQPVVIDNRAGAGGNIGTAIVARSKPDGHTLLITASGPIVINQHLYKNMQFDAKRDLQPVTNLLRVPQVLMVHPSVPAKNLQELIAYIKSQNGNFNWASAGVGTTQHMTGELFKSETKLQMNHIPYKGSAPAITDVVGGQVPMLIDSTIAAVPMIKSGKLRAIAVSGKTRALNLPDVPTFEEAGMPGFESYAWYGLFAPAGVPADVIAKLNDTAQKYMQSAEFKQVLTDTGSDYVGTDPATFGKFIDEESARWARLAPTLNLSLD